MGKKYEAYSKAAKAEAQSKNRYEAESVGGDAGAAAHALNDYKQNSQIADALFTEMLDDPTG